MKRQKIMKSPDMFDKKRYQLFDCKTGEFICYSKYGKNFNINEAEPEHVKPEPIYEKQLNLF
jgi:hypothetical protein